MYKRFYQAERELIYILGNLERDRGLQLSGIGATGNNNDARS